MTGIDATWVEQGIALLGDLAVKATVILALAGGATFLMRRAAAATRHLVWTAAVVAVLLLPVLRTMAPQWVRPSIPALPSVAALWPSATAIAPRAPTTSRVAIDAAPAAPATAVAPASSIASASRANAPAAVESTTEREHAAGPAVLVAPAPQASPAPPLPASSASAAPFPSTWIDVSAVLLSVWAAGALAILLRLAIGTLSLAGVARRAPRVADREWHALLGRLVRELGIRRRVRLLEGGRGDVPMTWGVLRPVVLLPRDAEGWSEGRRRAVLLHELAHVERFDTLTHILSQVALALLWFHPLALLASRRLRAERERACDDLVLAMGTVRATAYADDLLELVQTLGTPRALSAALAMARPSEFEGRLLSILDPRAPRVRIDRRRAALAVVIMAAAALPLAGMRSAEAAPASQHPSRDGRSTRDSIPPLGELAAIPSTLDSQPVPGPLPALDLDSMVRLTTSATTGAATTSIPVDTMLEARVREELARAQRALDSAGLALAHDEAEALRTPAASAPAAPRAQSALSAAALVDVIRATHGMGSDSDRAAVLLRLVSRMTESAGTREAFLDATMGMSSSAERRRVLVPVVRQHGDDSTLAGVARAAAAMTTESERVTVLKAVTARGRLSNAAVRQGYFAALNGTTSERLRGEVLAAAIVAESTSDAVHRAVIESIGTITSERLRANLLLQLANGTPVLSNPARRAQFLATLGTLTASSEYRRVMDAVTR